MVKRRKGLSKAPSKNASLIPEEFKEEVNAFSKEVCFFMRNGLCYRIDNSPGKCTGICTSWRAYIFKHNDDGSIDYTKKCLKLTYYEDHPLAKTGIIQSDRQHQNKLDDHQELKEEELDDTWD